MINSVACIWFRFTVASGHLGHVSGWKLLRVERPLHTLHPQSMQALGFLEVTLAMLNNWGCMALVGHRMLVFVFSMPSGDLASWDEGCRNAWV